MDWQRWSKFQLETKARKLTNSLSRCLAIPTVAASLAHECLKTVPLGKEEAIKLIDAIEPYLEWQSDAGYKKDPPESYFYPGFDIFGNLASVRSNVEAGKYAGEFDFQTDLYKQVWAPGQDGHYVFYPDLLAKAFRWRRAVPPIVSISEDGESLPVIKLQSESWASPTASVACVNKGANKQTL